MGYELRRHGPIGNWHIFWSENRRSKRRSTGTRDRSEADRVLAAFVLEKDRPAQAEPDEYSVGALIDQYWREKGSKGEGAKDNRFHMQHVRRFHGDDTVAALTEDRHDEYEAACVADGVAPGTINRRRAVLRAALRHALRRQRITSIPLVPTLEEPEADSRHFTRAQIARLLRAARAKKDLHHAAIFIALMLATGHRMTAVLQLTWDRVDLENGTADFRLPGKKHKRKKRTRAALPDKTIRLLRNWRRRSPGPYVVSRTGRFAQHFQRRHWKRVIRAAGLEAEAQRTHTLKHTAATWALRVASPWLVEGQMATSARTLMRVYGKHLGEDLKSVTELVAHSRPGSARRVPDVKNKSPRKKATTKRKMRYNKR
jgi:integrase